MASQKRGADMLAESIRRAGATRIFTLSGNHIMSVFDAALDAGIELVHVRHEAAAVHMADAWARLTGTPGIAMVTAGSGHGNAVSALYTAQMSESPVILLSGSAPVSKAGWGTFQEIDQPAMAAPVSKASWASASADALAGDFARAWSLAASGRRGPVHLSLPTDALEGPVAKQELPPKEAYAPQSQPLARDGLAADILARLRQARRPLVVAGPAGLTDAGRQAMRDLQAATGLPVVATESPRGSKDPSLGAFAQVLSQADCVLLLGKRLDFTLGHGKAPVIADDCRFLQIDADSSELDRSRRAVGDRLEWAELAEPLAAAGQLTRAGGAQGGYGAWCDEVRAAVDYRPPEWQSAGQAAGKGIHPAALFRPVQELLDSHPDSVLISDGGECGQWAQACLRAGHRVVNGVAGAIGSALPMALGARCAYPDAPIVAVMGDGTFGFHCAEIDTGVRYGLPFVCLVANDARWNAEYQIQLNAYGKDRLIGCELLPTRYEKVAQGFGAQGACVDDLAALPAALKQAAAERRVPFCLNVALEGLPAPLVRR